MKPAFILTILALVLCALPRAVAAPASSAHLRAMASEVCSDRLGLVRGTAAFAECVRRELVALRQPAPKPAADYSGVPPARPAAISFDIPPIWSKVSVLGNVVGEMATVEAVCIVTPGETAYAIIHCRDGADRTVWAHHEPGTLDLFDQASAQRLQAAIAFDRQSSSPDALVAQLGVIDLQLAYARNDRQASANAAAQAQATQQAQAQKQRVDEAQCQSEGQVAVNNLPQLPACRGCTGINVLTIIETRQNTYQRCMVARGYTFSQ